MSELVWGIKNGDLDIVKDYVESKVSWRKAVWHIQFKRFSNVYKFYFHKLDRIYVQEDAYVQGLKNHKIDKWCNLFGYGVTFFV